MWMHHIDVLSTPGSYCPCILNLQMTLWDSLFPFAQLPHLKMGTLEFGMKCLCPNMCQIRFTSAGDGSVIKVTDWFWALVFHRFGGSIPPWGGLALFRKGSLKKVPNSLWMFSNSWQPERQLLPMTITIDSPTKRKFYFLFLLRSFK